MQLFFVLFDAIYCFTHHALVHIFLIKSTHCNWSTARYVCIISLSGVSFLKFISQTFWVSEYIALWLSKCVVLFAWNISNTLVPFTECKTLLSLFCNGLCHYRHWLELAVTLLEIYIRNLLTKNLVSRHQIRQIMIIAHHWTYFQINLCLTAKSFPYNKFTTSNDLCVATILWLVVSKQSCYWCQVDQEGTNSKCFSAVCKIQNQKIWLIKNTRKNRNLRKNLLTFFPKYNLYKK